jgi:glycerol uptake facilitator-like aquaporin
MTAARRLVGELLGTALLLAAVVGSGMMGERLSGGNVAIALLANTLATGAMLVTLIFTFGAVSGAHFNPAVTLADASQGGMRWRDVPGYIAAQTAGAMLGVWAAHLMSRSRCSRYRSTFGREVPSSSVNSSPLSDCSPLSGAAGGYAQKPCPSQSGFTLPPLTGSRRPRRSQIRR